MFIQSLYLIAIEFVNIPESRLFTFMQKIVMEAIKKKILYLKSLNMRNMWKCYSPKLIEFLLE